MELCLTGGGAWPRLWGAESEKMPREEVEPAAFDDGKDAEDRWGIDAEHEAEARYYEDEEDS